MTTCRVLLVDDHALFRRGLADVLEQAGFDVTAEAASGEDAVAALASQEPDVVLMDLHMPGMGGVEATRRMAGQTRILVLTVSESDDDLRDAIHAGAAGYLLKSASPDALVAAVRSVAEGGGALSPEITPKVLATARHAPTTDGPALSTRERQVVAMLSQGLSNREIGERLDISTHTVKTYLDRIFDKFGVRSRAAVASKAQRRDPTQ